MSLTAPVLAASLRRVGRGPIVRIYRSKCGLAPASSTGRRLRFRLFGRRFLRGRGWRWRQRLGAALDRNQAAARKSIDAGMLARRVGEARDALAALRPN